MERNRESTTIGVDEDAGIQNAEPLPEPCAPTQTQINSYNALGADIVLQPGVGIVLRSDSLTLRRNQNRSSSLTTAPPEATMTRNWQQFSLPKCTLQRHWWQRYAQATVCPHKGIDERVISRVASFIIRFVYQSIVYRSDQTTSIRAMFEEDLNQKSIGSKGAPAIPKPDLNAKLFEDPEDHDAMLDILPDDLFEDPPAHDLDPNPETPTAQPQSPAMDAD